MHLKQFSSLVLASSIALTACNSSSDSDRSNQQTSLTDAEAARAFVLDLKNVMAPVAETQDVLTDYSVQLNQDLTAIDSRSSAALLMVAAAVLQSLADRIEDAYVLNDSGYLTAINWDLWPETINVEGLSGLTITRNGAVLSITGSGLEVDPGLAVDIAATLVLPDVDVTQNTVSITMTELRLTDSIDSITANSGALSLHFNDSLNASEPKDFIIEDVTLSADTLKVVMGDIEISGDGRYHLTGNPNDDDSGINAFDVTDTDVLFGPFSLMIDGELKNSQGVVLDTTTTMSLNYDRQLPYYYYYDNARLSNLDLDVSFEFDLTDKTTSNTLLLATMVLDVKVDDGLEIENGDIINTEDVTDFDFNGTLNLTVGQTQVGFGINAAMTDSVTEQAYLFDAANKNQDVRLTYLANPSYDFDKKEIVFASVTVDGTTLADVVMDWEDNLIVADFTAQEDVILLSDDRVASIAEAFDME